MSGSLKIVSGSCSYSLRNYRADEGDLACDVRGLESEESRARFKKLLEAIGEWTDHYLHLAIDKDGELIGDLQLRHCEKTMPDGLAHIGIDISEDQRGKGAGSIALELAWQWAQVNNFHRLEGSTEVTNVAMRRAFEKAGWSFEGTLKNLFFKDGAGHDYLSFAKTI
jgi:RimJ/RimL family protein N-acetyltransferase